MNKFRSLQNKQKGKRMGVALRSDRIKVFSRTDRNKLSNAVVPNTSDERKKEFQDRKHALLSEIINYEKQNFDDWPDGRYFLEATRKEMYKIDDRLDSFLKKK